MAGESPQKAIEPSRVVEKPFKPLKADKPAVSVGGLIAGFLADAEGRMTPACLRTYRCFLVSFAHKFNGREDETFTPQEAEALARKPAWSSTYRANFLTAVGAVYRWACRERLIARNPMLSLRKPIRQSRGTSAVLSADEHAELLVHAKSGTKDLLTVLGATGARPGEACGLTAETVKASADGVIPLTRHKTAGKGKPRVLIPTGEAWNVVKRRAESGGSGWVFPNDKGKRLTAQAVAHRMKKPCRRAGVRHLFPYGYRHTIATDSLTKGVPDATVAALLGHSGTTMLHRHYSHLTSRADVLRQAAALVRWA